MAKRITDKELEIRHSVMHVLLAALGYIPDDSSLATIRKVQKRFDEAVAAGRMTYDPNGPVYAVSRAYYDGQVQKNSAQSRAA